MVVLVGGVEEVCVEMVERGDCDDVGIRMGVEFGVRRIWMSVYSRFIM